ncbi:uncharacterized protein LOC132267252 isoform X3 [Cornus florida]|uniref:uncharacterized protein LOC132267252 isoform X3 n=1 Tax=Cornus florida TaxID=4283 RepID=UPI00289B97DA|nr:uncharacterized protein LOC132267252 isoform X3 [Cornus florida]XP_059624342.1 uncharacterized protein LOC132267252 isoform X3 [Cornus florida]XP_059624343.1 uncharacterized protein LOC132267252 isoform X3 [Cornus florida]
MNNDMQNPPPSVEEDQWDYLIRYWRTEAAQKQSQQNEVNRSKQTMLHTTGTMSYAWKAEKMKLELGKAPTRAQLFCATHKSKKDGKASDEHAAKMITQLEELAATQPFNPDEPSPYDFYAQVRGEERRGRVRMYGLGPTPTSLWGPSPSKAELIRRTSQAEEVARRARAEMNEKVDKMRAEYDEKYEALNAKMAMILRHIENQNSNVQVPGSSTTTLGDP